MMQGFTGNDDLNSQMKTHDWTLLYFTASWCGPCKTMSPVMDKVSEQNTAKFNAIKIDVDGAQDLAGQYGVRGIPTLVLINKEKVVDTVVGSLPQAQVQQWLNSHL